MTATNVTIVFQKIKEAIEAVNDDGSRKYKYIINEGSSRSSKTQSIIQFIDQYCSTNLDKRVCVWRDTKSDCIATVGFDIYKIIRQLPNYDFKKHTNTQDYKRIDYYRYWTKSVFELNGTDDEEKIIGFQGDISWFNEPYKIGKETFDQLDMRTSDFIIIDWNPKKSHWIEDLKKDPRAITIKSTYKDNPFCPPEQRIKIESYQPVSMSQVVLSGLISEMEAFDYDLKDNKKEFTEIQLKELQRCILNHEKNTASEFNHKVYAKGEKAERPNRIFTNWKPIQESDYKAIDSTIYYGVDWGQVDPFGVLEAKYHDGAIYLHELNYLSENELKTKMDFSSLNKIRESEEGIVKWLFDRLNVNKKSYIICDNNRPQKVMALRQAGYEYAISASKGKGSVNDGIDILTNLKVYYTNSSKNVEFEYENYQYKEDRYGLIIEEPVDADNHLIDPARYVTLFLRNQRIIKTI